MPVDLDSSTISSTLTSVIPCSLTSSPSKGQLVCKVPRKMKAPTPTKRHRSNEAILLLGPKESILPIVGSNFDCIIEILALLLDRSINIVDNTIVLNNNKGKGKLLVCEEEDNELDNEFQLEPSTKKMKKSYNASCKFQDTWVAQFSWAELYKRSNGLYEFVKCLVCLLIVGKDKIPGPKWTR